MKIVEANVSLASEHYSSKQFHIEESLKFWVEFQTPIEAGKTHPTQIQGSTTDWNRLFSDLEKLLEKYQIEIAPVNENEIQVKDLDRIKLQIIERFIKILTGKNLRFKVLRRSDFTVLILPLALQNNQLPQTPNIKFAYHRREISWESEKLLFTATGTIITADGQRIDFDTQMFVSRELASLSNISVEASKLIDPLVINFNGLAAGITETKFRFDLDVDGIEEMIPFVSEGSGLLALDLNEDQQINDGSELFGAVTGNGFEELSQYDQDGNGWIDETDPIFDRLRIWTKDAEGQDTLFALGQKGVGAIFLGNVDAQFGVGNQENRLAAQYQKAGIYMRADGAVGTVQQVDFIA